MTVFLTSSPTGPLDGSRPVDGLDDQNRFAENLRSRWPEAARCLYITASPEAYGENDWIRESMAAVFARRGMTLGFFDVWDDRREDLSARELHDYEVLILGGGHVPTQNAFFQRISLREKLAGFRGLVIGISAGTMNAARRVYAQPEEPGESVDPDYRRFLEGLGLTEINVLPHYQMVKDFTLDGKRLFEDITYADSWGETFWALPDGSYLLIEGGRTLLFGEAYRLSDGSMEKINEDGQIAEL